MLLSKKDIIEKNAAEDKLFFKYLPDYAAFLLTHHLESYAQEQLKYSREEQVPLLRFFEHLPEAELIAMGKKSGVDFLNIFIENKAREHIKKSAGDYIKNRIPSIEREQVVAQDITTISFIRRKIFSKFLALYTTDNVLADAIREELDRFVVESEVASFNAYIEIQQEKISRINAELAQRQDDLLEAQELAKMGSFLWDFKEGKSAYTPGVMKIFDMTRTSNLDSFLENVHEDDRRMLKEAIDRSLKENGIYECEYRFIKNNKEKRIWSRGLVNFRDGVAVSMKGTIMDVTGKHRMLAQLQEKEEYLAQLIHHAPDAIIVIEASGKITLWNPKAEEIFGWEAGEVLGTSLSEVIIPAQYREAYKSNMERLLKKAVDKTSDKNLEIIALTKQGQELYVSLTISRSIQQKKSLFIVFLRNITYEKLAKAELHAKTLQLENLNASLAFKNTELERINKELESFNYVASHDLQEPLRKIQIFTSRILEKGEGVLSPAIVEYFDKIMSSSARMQLLIEDLLMFSQTTANEKSFETTDMNAVLDEVKIILSASIEEKKAIIESTHLPVLKAVPFQLQQLLLNLIGNAIKYSKEGTVPHIKISTTVIEGQKISVPAAITDKNYIELTVADNGIGFGEENEEKIFGLFQRLHNKDKYSGTGIGLAICKKIAHNHSGFIKATSVAKKGSIFYVYFPQDKDVQHTARNLIN